jgi:hypothetical protein
MVGVRIGNPTRRRRRFGALAYTFLGEMTYEPETLHTVFCSYVQAHSDSRRVYTTKAKQ